MSPKLYFKLSALCLGAFLLSATGAIAQEIEPNNTFEQATVLPPETWLNGTITNRGDTDWYKFTAPDDGGVDINMIYGTPMTLDFFGSDGVTILMHSDGFMMLDLITQGVYYLRVAEKNPDTSATYGLLVSFSPIGFANDLEPNNISSQALGLPLNGSKEGHIGYQVNNTRDSVDWYKLTTNADGNLLITLDDPWGHGLKQLSIYDADAVTLLADTYSEVPAFLEKDALGAGTYYIKQSLQSDYSYGGYKISDTLIATKLSNDKEPNDNFSEAVLLTLNQSITGHIGYYIDHHKDTVDWYKIILKADGTLTLSLNGPGVDYFTLNLYKSPGAAPLASATIGTGTAGFEISSLCAGTYYARVAGASGTEFGPYTISNNFLSALPVSLINFEGKLIANTAVLSWRTTAEINNKGFNVQRSTDGQNFSDIGFVAGKGNSQVENNYSFTDANVLSGSNFYRLKQIDLDNQFTYSSIIKIDYSKFYWGILGNPLTDHSLIQLQLDSKENISVQIFSASGELIRSLDKGDFSAGTYFIPLQLSNISSGSYVVKLKVGNRSYTKMVTK